jgi:hypothetical protein
MARKTKIPAHKFTNKLVLNQWLISLFGIDPLMEYENKTRPFHKLAKPIKDSQLEGYDADGLHRFYHALINSELFYNDTHIISKEQLLTYEENIIAHTNEINRRRKRPIVWKYFQWLTLVFIEIYLDKYFNNRQGLLSELNAYVEAFNQHWTEYESVPAYEDDDLNKLCLQNATGSGKTLLMHVNLLQFRQYAQKSKAGKEISRVILLTPNERLSEQHLEEFNNSGFAFAQRLQPNSSESMDLIEVLEITKLGDTEGPNTIATRSLGDQNLLLVDEGHRGMSGSDEGVWFTRRSELCAKGFTFEYSATFEQAVAASGSKSFEDSYTKAVIFDYSYRWFYEDHFGKDYQILNLPKAYDQIQNVYLTSCLLKFYQQLLVYENKKREFVPFNIEKPLWVFVGSTVSKAKGGSKDEAIVVTDVAQIIHFIADYLNKPQVYKEFIAKILYSTGADTGLIDDQGIDIFANAFSYITKEFSSKKNDDLYSDILKKLFNNSAGGQLKLGRIKGGSGEIALYIGNTEEPFGLINVGDSKGLCDHVEETAKQENIPITVEESEFSEAMFASVKDSSSPVNLLIGSKKFVEGWDCWRVSTMGLMHVGKTEGSQIIQLFGRGVRLKGYEWSLMRSGYTSAPKKPTDINIIETLNVFGIESDFMEKFKKFLANEGLPGNERKEVISIPMNVTYDFGKKLKVLRPKRKKDGEKLRDISFKIDGPVPTLGEVPAYLQRNPVISDWYPRIQTIRSKGVSQVGVKDEVKLGKKQICLLDLDKLYFDLERFKREKSWYNLNITKAGIEKLLQDVSWYNLLLPESRLTPLSYDDVGILQQVASELLKRFCEKYYQYCNREFIEPRLEYRELTKDDENILNSDYQITVDVSTGDQTQVIEGIKKLKEDLLQHKDTLLQVGDFKAVNFSKHLYEPLVRLTQNGKISILPVALNESEYTFVSDLVSWCEKHKAELIKQNKELYLLRNLSKGKGVFFSEAGYFYPDFMLWILVDNIQYLHFIEPHGLHHEGIASEKIQFYKGIKDIENRLNDPDVILNSWIISTTPYWQLKWGVTQEKLEKMNVLFFDADRGYLSKILH